MRFLVNPYSFEAAGVQPTDFPNLVMWYRGDYQAWAGGGPVPDGSLIDFWGEKVAGIANAAQGIALDQPLFQSAELNGQDVIEFQGTGADIRALGVPHADCPTFDGVGDEDYTIHMVFKPTSFATYQMLVTKGVPNVSANVPEFRVNPSGNVELVEDGNYTVAATTALTSGVWQVIAGVRDEGGAALRHYLGSVLNGSAARGTSTASATTFNIGRRDDGFTILDGFIAEILVYKYAFTDADVTALAPYWLARYGL